MIENSGAGERTRTADLLITNQLLYQLSYAGLWDACEWCARSTHAQQRMVAHGVVSPV